MPLSSDRATRPTQPIDVRQARYFEQVQEVLHFTPEELALLGENGFLVTDRLTFEQFKRAYAYIYWKDLPVLITTDSILHTIYLHYCELLKAVEGDIVATLLARTLLLTRIVIQHQAIANQDTHLAPIYEDLDVYLCVAYELLRLPEHHVDKHPTGVPPRAQPIIDALHWLNMEEWERKAAIRVEEVPADKVLDAFGLNGGNGKVVELTLFGAKQPVDISQFKARGHYTEASRQGPLKHYFTAMMWLARVNFVFLESVERGQPIINRGALAAAHILRDALERARQRQNVETIDRLLRAFAGWSDNVTLGGLDTFIRDAGAAQPADYFSLDDESLSHLLQTNDYGQQEITGSPLAGSDDPSVATPRPVIFSLMGQRFNLESWIMGELVYDRLVAGGRKSPRAYPSPLDVMAALGNDRAFANLASEFSRYGHEDGLRALRTQVATHSSEFWESTFYNRWLQAIRVLNNLADSRAPAALRSPAWADKMLHTQLASWTQLRHENILLVKDPYTIACICEYPSGYVEPYPAFYAAVKDYADFGLQVLKSLDLDERDGAVSRIVSSETAFFQRLSSAANQLHGLAQKELDGVPFTEAENLFVRSVVVRKSVVRNSDRGPYGGGDEETWGGWYSDLVGWDKTPALVADIHTNLNKDIGEVGVLHTATGNPVIEALVVESDEGSMIYVGPVFTYYEFCMTGYPLTRLTDEEWRQRLAAQPQKVPDWTQSFRLSHDGQPESLKLPGSGDAAKP